MAFKVKEHVTGLKEILQAMDDLPKNLRKKHLRKAMSDIAKKILWAAKARTPRGTGLLRKSLGRKIKVYPSGVVVGIVGARRGFRQQVGERVKDSRPGTKYPKQAGDPIYVDPTKYLHLVELGTVRSKAAHMLRDALAEGRAMATARFRQALEDAVKESMAKAVRK